MPNVDEKKVSLTDRAIELINKTNMTLEDTIELMKSEDYKERLVAEYFQAKIRFDAINTMIIKMEAGTLEVKPKTPQNTFEDQLYYMNEYIKILRIRAELEGIDLEPTVPVANPLGEILPEEKKEELPIEEPTTDNGNSDSNVEVGPTGEV